MSERMSSGLIEYGPKKLQIVRDIGQAALTTVQARYGSGYPNYCAGELSLGNHNRHHSFKVGENSAKLAEDQGLTAFATELSRTTGNAHDIVQRKGRGVDESESADWLEQELRRQGIAPDALTVARAAILGTQPRFDQEGIMVDQQVNHMEFESIFAERFAKVVASADLGELFTPLGPLLAHKLYAEIQGVGALDSPSMDDFTEFSRKQLVFVDRYQYPLGNCAEQLFATHKKQVIRYFEYVYDQCLSGALDSWEQLMRQDKAFISNPDMRRHDIAQHPST